MLQEYQKVGMLCAAPFEFQWHRAIIVEILDISIVVNINYVFALCKIIYFIIKTLFIQLVNHLLKVLYIDYGTIGEVKMDELRFLSKQFSKQPPLVTRGCLDKVRPTHGIWSMDAIKVFMHMINDDCQNIEVLARITAVNQKVIDIAPSKEFQSL